MLRNRLLILSVVAGMSCTTVVGHAQFTADNPDAACSHENLKHVSNVDHYVFESYRNEHNGTACLLVLRNREIILRYTNGNDGEYLIGQHPDPKRYWDVPEIPDGTDITGEGYPNMIVSSYSGGAHCCLSTYIFRLEPTFKLIATLDAQDSWPAYFADLDHNHHYFWFARDWTFAYWPSSFAGSPSAPVILQFETNRKGGKYHLALQKMHRPAPSSNEWAKEKNDARAMFASGGLDISSGPTLWNSILNLIYSGHSELAWKFFSQTWPSKLSGKDEWLGNFCSVLMSSPYWPDLKSSVQNAPPACANAKAPSAK